MAQQIALLVHQQSREHDDRIDSSLFLCHHTSHLLIHEQDSYSKLLHMTATIIKNSRDITERIQYPMSYHDVYTKLFYDSSTYDGGNESHQLPSTVILECPHREIGGKNTTYEDLQLLSKLCRDSNIAFHMDGARIWEAAVYYNYNNNGRSDNDYSAVRGDSDNAILPNETMQETLHRVAGLFDSLYVSTYKGLGAMTGSLLIGSKGFIQEARLWLRRFGGTVIVIVIMMNEALGVMHSNMSLYNIMYAMI